MIQANGTNKNDPSKYYFAPAKYDRWYTRPFTSTYALSAYEHILRAANPYIMPYLRGPPGKKRWRSRQHRGPRKRQRVHDVSHLGQNINVASNQTCSNGVPHKMILDGDAGNISAKGSTIKCVQSGLVYEVYPNGKPFTKFYRDKRPLLMQLALPVYQTYASATSGQQVASSPNQVCFQIGEYLSAPELIKIRNLLIAHQSAAEVAGGSGGLAPQLTVPATAANQSNNKLKVLDWRSKMTFRNYTSIECHLILEEWLCRKDTVTANTPIALYNDWLTYVEDNNATIDTAVADVTWQTNAATTCRVATLADVAEKIRGPAPQRFWKKIKTTVMSIASGRTIGYTMVQKPFQINKSTQSEYTANAVNFIGGLSRVLIGYLSGSKCGSTLTTSHISVGDAGVNYKAEHFVVYCNNLDNPKRRDITYTTAMASIWPTVAPGNQTYTNEETEALEIGVATGH